MLATAELIATVAAALRRYQPRFVVLDPVWWPRAAIGCCAPKRSRRCSALLPLATIVTPNLPEAADLLGMPAAADLAGMREAAQDLARQRRRCGAREGWAPFGLEVGRCAL